MYMDMPCSSSTYRDSSSLAVFALTLACVGQPCLVQGTNLAIDVNETNVPFPRPSFNLVSPYIADPSVHRLAVHLLFSSVLICVVVFTEYQHRLDVRRTVA
ncbi:hypothetical protein K438DRAFT_1882108 [Mycena galopus ATCC 62051]|nr:hypothetical protein K438DRAFT_1882108 [Mycena galopus ATCC 62051]